MSIATRQYKSNIACQKMARQVINSLTRKKIPMSLIAGKSVDVITTKRIEEIKSKDTDISLRELAYLLGFNLTIGRCKSKLMFKKLRF